MSIARGKTANKPGLWLLRSRRRHDLNVRCGVLPVRQFEGLQFGPERFRDFCRIARGDDDKKLRNRLAFFGDKPNACDPDNLLQRCDPRASAASLDSLDQHVGSMGRQRLQVVRIGRKYGPSGFRERHDKCIDGRPTAGQSPQ